MHSSIYRPSTGNTRFNGDSLCSITEIVRNPFKKGSCNSMLSEFKHETSVPHSIKCFGHVAENHTGKLVIVASLADVVVYVDKLIGS